MNYENIKESGTFLASSFLSQTCTGTFVNPASQQPVPISYSAGVSVMPVGLNPGWSSHLLWSLFGYRGR